MAGPQRFCPLCDRVFVEGEAVLACQGCGVLHHPACWVRNDGCATPEEHETSSVARAYHTLEGAPATRTQPGDGVRKQRLAGGDPTGGAPTALIAPGKPEVAMAERAPSVPTLARTATATEPASTPDREPSVVPPRLASRPLEPPGASVRHGRYVPPEEEFVPVRKPLPGLYREHRWLQYWYIPVAAAVSLLAAAGVIFGVAKLAGDSGDDDARSAVFEATATPAEIPTLTPTGTPQPAASVAATATATARPTGGKYQIGDKLLVAGAGDCLNVRVAADRTKDAIVCLQDGAEVTVTGGPEKADSFTWWKVNTKLGEGWAVEDYLARKP